MRERLLFERSDIPAVTHLDYTARLQTVSRDTNRPYYDLISAFKALTGYGIIVNTSFNVRGEPIVRTPQEAYRCFMGTEMDVLVMEDFLLLKGDQPAWHSAESTPNKGSRIDPRDVRKFGITSTAFFFGLLCVSVWLKKPLAYLFAGLFFLGIGFWTMPVRLREIYGIWMRMSHTVGRAITSVSLGLSFYGVITPAALLKRILGGRPLPLKPDRKVRTYWKTRSEFTQARDRFLKRY